MHLRYVKALYYFTLQIIIKRSFLILFKMRFFSLLISAVLLFTSCSNEEPVIADFEFVEKEKGLVLFTNKSSGAETYE